MTTHDPSSLEHGGLEAKVLSDLAARSDHATAKATIEAALRAGFATRVTSEAGRAIVLRRVMQRHSALVQSIIDRQACRKDAPDLCELHTICLETGFAPDAAQQRAIETILSSPISIVHGGPGCGKTTVAGIAARYIERAEPSHRQVVVAFSAKVAMETARKCGLEGSTMHAFAGLAPGEEMQDTDIVRDDVGTLYVDEAFSAQPALLNAMFRTTPPHCRIVFLGDPMQLAPIGDGRALHDALAIGLIPSARLETSHRLGGNSHLSKQAARIASGQQPTAGPNLAILESGLGQSQSQAATERAAYAVRLHKEAIARRRSCVMLTPVQYGISGHVSLNALVSRGSPRVGDPIVAIETDRDGRWRNGQRGTVLASALKQLTIQMETGKVVDAVWGERGFLLAHAMSAHRAQGLEYDESILLLTRENERTATRQMMVSAMTRARKCTIITEPGVLAKIVSRDQLHDRPRTLQAAIERRTDKAR